MSKIPGIGDIPILGLLFKSKAHQKNQTELVVMITPTIIKKGQMGVSEGLPSLVEPYLARPDKTLSESRSLHRLAALSGGSAAAARRQRRGRAPRQGARSRCPRRCARAEGDADGHRPCHRVRFRRPRQ